MKTSFKRLTISGMNLQQARKAKKKVVDFFYEREKELANSSKKKDKKTE